MIHVRLKSDPSFLSLLHMQWFPSCCKVLIAMMAYIVQNALYSLNHFFLVVMLWAINKYFILYLVARHLIFFLSMQHTKLSMTPVLICPINFWYIQYLTKCWFHRPALFLITARKITSVWSPEALGFTLSRARIRTDPTRSEFSLAVSVFLPD